MLLRGDAGVIDIARACVLVGGERAEGDADEILEHNFFNNVDFEKIQKRA